ncbi:MAG: hypothetical protein V1870_01345 [Candidatus Aenigmatarchaeota archaeon]
MKINIISDIRAGLIFLAVMLVCPVETASGWSVLALHILNIPVLGANYVILIIVFIIALALATGITMMMDRSKKKMPEKKPVVGKKIITEKKGRK